MKRNLYPFSAIVGQEKMKTALLVNAVDPAIGGVLISGHKGTGKSTAVRALARILPQVQGVADCPYHCPLEDPGRMCDACARRCAQGETLATAVRVMPVVELPLSATEDRVVGTLHVEHALKTGRRRFEPGLMAAANNGILYVDEVNLLDDHLVDILLDAAASGINIVEREGISHSHPARFILVGTMNPEEGDLRPQFLDRFGLSLTIRSVADLGMRREIARRRISFDQDPEAFCQQWEPADRIIARQVAQARGHLDSIKVSNAMIDLAVRLSTAVEAQGHRAEIAILKTAKAMAAILEQPRVESAHIAEAARLVLPHRITQVALATPEMLAQTLEEALRRELDGQPIPARPAADDSSPDDWEDEDISTEVPGSWAASNTDMIFSFLEDKKKLFSTPMN